MMEVNLIILPKNNSDINIGMKKQITDLFKSMFDDVSEDISVWVFFSSCDEEVFN